MSDVIDFIAFPLENNTLSSLNSNLVLAEWTIEGTPPDSQPEWMAPLHIHHNDDEAWYVLEGALGVRIGEKTYELNEGDAIIAPRGEPHTFWNPKSTSVKYIIVMTKRIKMLIDAIHSMENCDYQKMKMLFEQHDSELI